MSDVPRRAGFTLVELLVAATMMAVLFVGLGAHLHGGIVVWRRATQMQERLQQRRLALDRLALDLANAFWYDDTQRASDAPYLPRPFEHHKLQWYTVTHTGAQSPDRVRFVTYNCGPIDGVSGLWRTSQSLDKLQAQPPQPPTAQRLLPDCERLVAQYAYRPPSADSVEPIIWNDEWDEARVKNLPRLLNVSLQPASGVALSRRFTIPAGVFIEPPVPSS